MVADHETAVLELEREDSSLTQKMEDRFRELEHSVSGVSFDCEKMVKDARLGFERDAWMRFRDFSSEVGGEMQGIEDRMGERLDELEERLGKMVLSEARDSGFMFQDMVRNLDLFTDHGARLQDGVCEVGTELPALRDLGDEIHLLVAAHETWCQQLDFESVVVVDAQSS